MKGRADIGPNLSNCCKSRYFFVYIHVVNHAISTEIFHEKSRCNEEKIKSHPGVAQGIELWTGFIWGRPKRIGGVSIWISIAEDVLDTFPKMQILDIYPYL